MKFSPAWRIACVLTVAILAAFAGLKLSRKSISSPRPVQSPALPSVEPAVPALPVPAPLREDSGKVPVPAEPDRSTEAALQAIEAAESPTVVEPYLSSSVPEVRSAAVDALIRIGDSAAVPSLEAAARDLSPEEAAPLLEAARFLALPDATGLNGQMTAQHAREMGKGMPNLRKPKRGGQPPAEPASSGSSH